MFGPFLSFRWRAASRELINGLPVGAGLADHVIIGPSRYGVNLLSDFDIHIVQQETFGTPSGPFMEPLALMTTWWPATKQSGGSRPAPHEIHHPLPPRTVVRRLGDQPEESNTRRQPAHQALLQWCIVSLPVIASCGARLPNLEAIRKDWCHPLSTSTRVKAILAMRTGTGKKQPAQFPEKSQLAWSAARHRVEPRMVNERPAEPYPHWNQGVPDLVRTLDLHWILQPSNRPFLIPQEVPGLAVLTMSALNSWSWQIPVSSSVEIDCQAQISNQAAAGRTCPVDYAVWTPPARE